MTLRAATLWSIFWIAAALAFAGWLSVARDTSTAQLFLAGYVTEKSLSVDNLMVFTAIFSYFGIASSKRPFVLRWGIIGAIVFRALFVFLGAGILIAAGPVAGIGFGLLVLWSAFKMLTLNSEEDETDYEAKWFVRLAKRLSTTPAFLCMAAIEVSDIMFSFDSMPAVIALVRDPLIIYSSVIFAVLGLRSLYFVLDALMRYLTHLGTSVIALLFFIGMKMLLHSMAELFNLPSLDILNVNPQTNLAIIGGMLSAGIVASVLFPQKVSDDVG